MNYAINESLLAILKSFSDYDIKRFRKFLKSSYLNPYPKLINLFNSITSLTADFPEEEINRIEAYKRMNLKGQYNDSTMRDLISKLKLAADKYLAYTNFEENKLDFLSHTREQMYLRGLHHFVSKNINESEKLTENFVETDVNFFYRKMKIETEKFNNFVIAKKLFNKQQIEKSIISLNNSAKNLLAFFILETIKQNDNILKISKRQEIPKNRNIIPELLRPIDVKKIIITLKKNHKNLSHIFQIYYYLYLLFSSRNGERYFHLYKESIITNASRINSDELHFLFGRLIDYCVNKCNDEAYEYYNELFIAYEILLKKGYYANSSNKYISIDLFRNIFQTSVRIKNFKWASDFIEKYITELHPQNRDSMYSYCHSYLYFEKKNFNKSLDCIMKIKQDYFALKIDIKIMLLKIYYELGSYEQIYSQLDSFKHFIANHEMLLPSRRKRTIEFIKQYERLLKIKLAGEKDAAVVLSNHLAAKKDKHFYEWLYLKAEETGKL